MLRSQVVAAEQTKGDDVKPAVKTRRMEHSTATDLQPMRDGRMIPDADSAGHFVAQ